MGGSCSTPHQHPKTGSDLWALPLAGDRKPFPVVRDTLRRDGGAILARRAVGGVSVERIQASADLRPTVSESPAVQWQVSTAGGSQPRWRPDGKELFYVAADARLMAVPIAVGVDAPDAGGGHGRCRSSGRGSPAASNIPSGCPVEAAVCSRLRRALPDERGRRRGDRATHHGRSQLGRGVNEVTLCGSRWAGLSASGGAGRTNRAIQRLPLPVTSARTPLASSRPWICAMLG